MKFARARPHVVAATVLVDHFAAAVLLWMRPISEFEFQALRLKEVGFPLRDVLFGRARFTEGLQVSLSQRRTQAMSGELDCVARLLRLQQRGTSSEQ